MAKVYTEEYRKQRDEHRKKWLLGNAEAIEFVQTLTNIAEFWDDVKDNDKPITDDEMDAAFLGALFQLPANQFYSSNYKFFQSLMMSSVNAWKDSNHFMYCDDEKLRRLAFQLRFMLFEVTKMSAFLIGGWKHLREVSPQICEFYAYESFEDWEKDEDVSNVTELAHA